MTTDLASNCMMLPGTQASNVEGIRNHQRKRNKLPGIKIPNRPFCVKSYKQSAVKPRDAIGEKEEELALTVVS